MVVFILALSACFVGITYESIIQGESKNPYPFLLALVVFLLSLCVLFTQMPMP